MLPHIRANWSGKIANITSMGGKIHTPRGAWYHATKVALEAISDLSALDKVRAVSSDGFYAPHGNAVANSLSSESSETRSSPLGADRPHS